MKKTSLIIAATMMISNLAFSQDPKSLGLETDANSTAYVTGMQSEEVLKPSGLILTADINVYSLILQPVSNPNSDMLKRVAVQSGDGPVWGFMSDEVGKKNRGSYTAVAPNPLSYLVAGSSLNLLGQLEKIAKDMSLKIDDITVEQEFMFGLNNMVASIDKVTTNILVESSEKANLLVKLKDTALREWIIGEGLGNQTAIEGVLLINGTNFDVLKKQPGHVVADSILVQRTDGVISPVTIKMAEHKGERKHNSSKKNKDTQNNGDSQKSSKHKQSGERGSPPKSLSIQLTSVARSAHDETKPYLNIATLLPTQWNFKADDADLYGGVSSLPNSLHYYTAGTAFCLGTQMTLANAILRQDMSDMRIEQQFVFGKAAVDSLRTVIAAETTKTEEETKEWFKLSLNMCFAGAGLKNATPLINGYYLNNKLVN